MSEPITDELRRKMDTLGWYDEDGNIVYTTGDIPVSEIACFVINSKTFGELCDAIDAIHANLERENESLRRELDRVLGESDDVPESKGHVISHVTVEVTPHIDWSRMADEVDEFVQIVRGMAGDAE